MNQSATHISDLIKEIVDEIKEKKVDIEKVFDFLYLENELEKLESVKEKRNDQTN